MQGGSQHQAPHPNSRTVPVLGGGAGQETIDLCVMPPMSLGSGVGSLSSQPMARAARDILKTVQNRLTLKFLLSQLKL